MQLSRNYIDLPPGVPVRWTARSDSSHTNSKNAFCHVRKNFFHFPEIRLSLLHISLALIGVLGLTGNCEFAFCEEFTDYLSLTHHEVLSLRAIGERAHILHPVTSFSLLSVLFSTFGYVLSTPHKANP